jgi:hypothetical protein
MLANKYLIYVVVIVAALALGYYKGYSDKADEVQLKAYQDFVTVSEKLDKVYNFSVGKAEETRLYVSTTEGKLNSIIKGLNKPLTSVPCVPSEDFSSKWNELNNAAIISN